MTETNKINIELDKYYTKISIVNDFLGPIIKQYLQISKVDDIIIEPSAGNGAFIELIKSLCDNYKFYDILPENPQIEQVDYLSQSNIPDPIILSKYKSIHIIGNPPFGRQSSLAIKFIKKSVKFCHSLSLILPKSFKKASLQKSFPPNYHLIYQTDIAPNSFTINDNDCDVPCVFQIWIKQSNNRLINPILTPINFIFVQKNENPDISFRRVGVNAGTITHNKTEIATKSHQSHYFIKFISNNYDITKLKNIKYEADNTVGPKSISKQELIAKFNPLLENMNK